MSIFAFLIPTVAIIGMSALCAFLSPGQFSMRIFMVAAIIGISIMVWQNLYPLYMMIFAILGLVVLFFSDTKGTNTTTIIPVETIQKFVPRRFRRE